MVAIEVIPTSEVLDPVSLNYKRVLPVFIDPQFLLYIVVSGYTRLECSLDCGEEIRSVDNGSRQTQWVIFGQGQFLA